MEYINKKNRLKKFTIVGLFGTRTISINFSNNVKIIVGENGAGKTTLLTAMYHALSGNFEELKKLDFKTIILNFNSGEEIVLHRDDLTLMPAEAGSFLLYAKDNLTKSEYIDLVGFAISKGVFTKSRRNVFEKLRNRSKMAIGHMATVLKSVSDVDPNILLNISINQETLDAAKSEKLKRQISTDILYFPTYRRIEEDLHKLFGSDFVSGFDDEFELGDAGNKLIQFGMEDVAKKFWELSNILRRSALSAYASVSGEMLTQLVEGLTIDDALKSRLNEPQALKVVLDRLGGNLEDHYKLRIHDLVNSGAIYHPEHATLLYFLSKLVETYDQYRSIDNAIKLYADVCNKYLIGKTVEYDQSTTEINLVSNKTKLPIDLSKLSSGEKQIVSLFAKIYLDFSGNHIVLFDEPELSLSIEWQRELLPDILRSGNCNLLFAVTHSPFIFENELDFYTFDLNSYTQEYSHEGR